MQNINHWSQTMALTLYRHLQDTNLVDTVQSAPLSKCIKHLHNPVTGETPLLSTLTTCTSKGAINATWVLLP